MRLVTGTPANLQPCLMAGLARYRHKVFVEKLGWKLQCSDRMELDQFDREDTVYVVAQNDDEEIIGTARLLPTTRPYLLGEVFPNLMNGLPPPASEEVWELSRFSAVDFSAPLTSPLGQFSSPVAIDLLRASMRCAAARKAKKLITVSPMGIERLLNRAGFRSHRAGPPVATESGYIVGNWIHIE